MSQLALGLLVVVGLIFALGWLLRRVGPMAGQGRNTSACSAVCRWGRVTVCCG
ncbi:hypothetical protein UMZ34_01410 [Halopseudomonas pachastrellae]|nr:hypothetical protein UMZ34_01410 [Halopseudomonas pachastrellae]